MSKAYELSKLICHEPHVRSTPAVHKHKNAGNICPSAQQDIYALIQHSYIYTIIFKQRRLRPALLACNG